MDIHCVIQQPHTRDVPALFQEWGKAVAYDSGNNPFQVSVAIVIEKASGQVREVEPSSIRFVDPD